MVGALTYCTVYRVMVGGILAALFAGFDGTGQFSASADFDQNKLPSVIEDLFDMLWHVDDFTGRDDLVIAVHVAIVELVEPEVILSDPILIEVGDLRQVLDIAWAPE